MLLGRADRVLQRTSLFGEAGVEGAMRRHCEPVLERLVRVRLGRGTADLEAFTTFMTALRSADAVVVCGAGGVTDHARKWALPVLDRKSTRLNSSHPSISYAVFCLKKKNVMTQN